MLNYWQLVISESNVKGCVRIFMASGLILLGIMIYAPSVLASRIDKVALCANTNGCKTLTVVPRYYPDQGKLMWDAQVLTAHAIDTERLMEALQAVVNDSFLMSWFSQSIIISTERQKDSHAG